MIGSGVRDETILVVEDDQLSLELVRDVLVAAGFSVLEAATAESGLTLAASHQPALVLMDLLLPGMTGLEAAALLRSDPRTAHIPVVALTAHAMKGDREAVLAAGFAGYLPKPVETRRLPEELRAFIASHARRCGSPAA
jgi:two-component system cell cycle response regulator DivK